MMHPLPAPRVPRPLPTWLVHDGAIDAHRHADARFRAGGAGASTGTPPPVARSMLVSLVLLATWGILGGLLAGLALVQVLGLLGLSVDTGTSSVLHRAFWP